MTMFDNVLPVHPRTGLRAIGFTRRGPVWPVMGASEDPETPETPEVEPKPVPKPGPPKPKTESAQLPDDHPLVKTLAAQKEEIKALKARTAKLDELEDAQKTEAERAAERLAAADAEVAAVPQKVADQLRTHLVGLHQISDEDAELFLTATDPELLLKQVARLVEQSDSPRLPRPNPQQGNPSLGRGGTLSAGRVRYAAAHTQ